MTTETVGAQHQLLETLRQRNQELAALNAIANVFSSPLELAPSLNQVNEQIATNTGMETVTIHLTDESCEFLSLAGVPRYVGSFALASELTRAR